MTIKKPSKAGTLESNDISIILMPSNSGIEIELESIVENQFGDDIRNLIRETLIRLEINNVIVKAEDKGALDFTIISRVETAVARGVEQ